MNRKEEHLYEKHWQITSTGLVLLMTGSSLLYTTPTSIVKAEPTQNVSSSLQTSNQSDRTSVKKAMRIHSNLDTLEYSLKFLRVVKLELCCRDSGPENQEADENRVSLSHWQYDEDIHCNSSTSIGWREPLESR